MKNWNTGEVAMLKRMVGRFKIEEIAKRFNATVEDVTDKINDLNSPAPQANISADHEKQLAWVVAEIHKMQTELSYGKVTVCLDKGKVIRVVKEISIMNPD